MVDYKKMYYIICDAASKVIDAAPENAKRILQEALLDAENVYIHTCEAGDADED